MRFFLGLRARSFAMFWVVKLCLQGIYVTSVSPDSPASRAGLRVHDKLLQCNGYDLTLCTHKKAVSYIKKSSVLNLLIARKGVTSGWTVWIRQHRYSASSNSPPYRCDIQTVSTFLIQNHPFHFYKNFVAINFFYYFKFSIDENITKKNIQQKFKVSCFKICFKGLSLFVMTLLIWDSEEVLSYQNKANWSYWTLVVSVLI